MATISTLTRGTGVGPTSAFGNGSQAVLMENYIDFSAAVTAKGSALAAADVIECIKVPAGFQVLFAGYQKIAALTGTVSVNTMSLGITGVAATAYVSAHDYFALAVNGFGTVASTAVTPTLTTIGGADTIDLLIASQTGTITGGIIRVFAHVLDLNGGSRRGTLAQLGS